MELDDTIKTWFFKIALAKAIKRMVQLVVSWIISLGLSKYGISVDPDKLTVAIYGLLDILRNWLKIKFPKLGVWL